MTITETSHNVESRWCFLIKKKEKKTVQILYITSIDSATQLLSASLRIPYAHNNYYIAAQ